MKMGSRWGRTLQLAIVAADTMWFGFMASRLASSVSFTILFYAFIFVLYLLWMKDEEIRLPSAWLISIAIPLAASMFLWGISTGGITQLWAQFLCILAALLLPVSFLKSRYDVERHRS